MEISDQIKVFQKLHNVPRETIDQFTEYHNLLIKYQEKTNLVGSGTISTIWIRHFSDSAKLTDRIITYKNNANSIVRVCDVGLRCWISWLGVFFNAFKPKTSD